MILDLHFDTSVEKDRLALQVLVHFESEYYAPTVDLGPEPKPEVPQSPFQPEETPPAESLIKPEQFEQFPTSTNEVLYRKDIVDRYEITDSQFSRLQAGKYGVENVINASGKDSNKLLYSDSMMQLKIQRAKFNGMRAHGRFKQVQPNTSIGTTAYFGS